MVAHASISPVATCPCSKTPEVGLDGRCPLVDQRLRRGEYLFREGEPATAVWFVRRGCVVLTRSSRQGRAATPHAIRRVGTFLGLEGLVRSTYLDSARATAATLVGTATREVADAWFSQGGAARMALEQMLRAECCDAPRSCQAEGSALERVARWVLSEAARGPHPPVPRRDAAGLLGIVPETFSRALGQLAQAGAIEVSRRSLRVCDPAALRRAAALAP